MKRLLRSTTSLMVCCNGVVLAIMQAHWLVQTEWSPSCFSSSPPPARCLKLFNSRFLSLQVILGSMLGERPMVAFNPNLMDQWSELAMQDYQNWVVNSWLVLWTSSFAAVIAYTVGNKCCGRKWDWPIRLVNSYASMYKSTNTTVIIQHLAQ